MREDDDDIDVQEEKEFLTHLAAKRHKELVDALVLLSNAFNKEKPNLELQSLVNQNKDLISRFLSKLKELSQLKEPNINVQVNQKEVTDSVNKSSENIVNAVNKLSLEISEYTKAINAPKDTIAKISKRNLQGFADEITLKTTTKQ